MKNQERSNPQKKELLTFASMDALLKKFFLKSQPENVKVTTKSEKLPQKNAKKCVKVASKSESFEVKSQKLDRKSLHL